MLGFYVLNFAIKKNLFVLSSTGEPQMKSFAGISYAATPLGQLALNKVNKAETRFQPT